MFFFHVVMNSFAWLSLQEANLTSAMCTYVQLYVSAQNFNITYNNNSVLHVSRHCFLSDNLSASWLNTGFLKQQKNICRYLYPHIFVVNIAEDSQLLRGNNI